MPVGWRLPHRWVADPEVQGNFEAIERQIGAAPDAVVTSMPAASAELEGATVDYLADAANGVVWRFRCRFAGNASAYKWEFVGGSALQDSISNEGAKTAAVGLTYYDFTAPVQVTLPLAGDYEVQVSGNRIQSNTTYGSIYIRHFASAGAWAVDHNDQGFAHITYQFQHAPVSIMSTLAGATAGATVNVKYTHAGTVQAVNYTQVVLRVRPVRVS